MSVLRKEKKGNFTVIDNAIFKDCRLSYKAKGLLCQMLSLPDGWEFSVEGLATLSSDGRSAVSSALNELKRAGYFRRESIRDGNRIAGIEYVISEVPNVDFLIAENLISEKLTAENPQQLNTKESITDLSTTEGIYIPKPKIAEIKSEFEQLWNLYPKKQGKDKAYGYYERARKSGTTYEEVGQGIAAYREYIQANEIDMQYVKQGSTFFSQKAWADDWTIRSRKKSKNPFMDMLMNGDY